MAETASGKKIRVLSLDGGPSSTTYVYLLQDIVNQNPAFLSKIDVIAGNSDGAFLAMYLATRPKEAFDPANAQATVADMIAFCRNFFDACEPCMPGLGYLRLFSGLASYASERGVEKFLNNAYGSSSTLRDLPSGKRVVMPTYRITGSPPDTVIQSNIGERSHWDVSPTYAALRSGSFPVLFPLQNGHLDGGVFANNPALCALSQLIQEEGGERMKDIVVFSLGADAASWGRCVNHALKGKDLAKWGWIQWLFGAGQPLLLGTVLLDAMQRGVSTQMKGFIGDRYLRVTAPIGEGIFWQLLEYVLRLQDLMFWQGKRASAAWVDGKAKNFQPSYTDTIAWLDKHWYTP